MDAKLTLSLDEHIIKKAKAYAEKNRTSLSDVIENYLALLVAKDEKQVEISPLVKSLSGVVSLPEGYDYKAEKLKHLQEKYK